jgi:NADP-dependent 3-hydroxy acid dehydrogenase YdfG
MDKPVMIITGASSGIGAATARRMARDGLRLVLAARREDRLRSLAAEVKALSGEPLIVPTDVNHRADLENLVQSTLDCWGRVDILFNNAGVYFDDALEKMTPEKIHTELQTDLVAVIDAAQVVLPVMLRQKSGHIINTASLGGLVALPGGSIYSAAKFGVVGFSDSLRRELHGTGVQVSAFCPGFTPSELTPELKAHADGSPDAPKFLGLMPTTYVADQVADLIRRPRRMVIIPKRLHPVILIAYLFPSLADVLLKSILKSYEESRSGESPS